VKSCKPRFSRGDNKVLAKAVASNVEEYQPGDAVLAGGGSQGCAISDGSRVVKLVKNPQNPPWSLGSGLIASK